MKEEDEKKKDNIEDFNHDDEGEEMLLSSITKSRTECFICKKICDIISIIFLLSACIIPMCLKYDKLHQQFNTKTLHFQLAFEVFLSFFCLISFGLICCMLRLFCNDGELIKKVIVRKFGHCFYLGNLSTLWLLLTWTIPSFQYNGINIALALLSSVLYFIVYISPPTKPKLKGAINLICLQIPISFLLAWVNCLTITSFFIAIEHYEDHTSEFVEILSFTSHSFLFVLTVLMITYNHDLYYASIILLFQAGIILSNKDNYSNENKFTLVFGVLTALCFIFSLIFNNESEEMGEEEVDSVMRNAEIDKKENGVEKKTI